MNRGNVLEMLTTLTGTDVIVLACNKVAAQKDPSM